MAAAFEEWTCLGRGGGYRDEAEFLFVPKPDSYPRRRSDPAVKKLVPINCYRTRCHSFYLFIYLFLYLFIFLLCITSAFKPQWLNIGKASAR